MENNKLKFKNILIFALSVFILIFAFYIPVADAQLVPCGSAGKPACTLDHFWQLLVNIYNFLLGGMALVAMLMLVITGIQMMTYWLSGGVIETGKTSPASLAAAKGRLSNIIGGIILIACAYLIVNTLLGALGLTNSMVGCFLQKNLGFNFFDITKLPCP